MERYTFLQAFYDTYFKYIWPTTELGQADPTSLPTVSEVAKAVCNQIKASVKRTTKDGKKVYEGEKFRQQELAVALDIRGITTWLIDRTDKYEELGQEVHQLLPHASITIT